jgi:hypothetical protein
MRQSSTLGEFTAFENVQQQQNLSISLLAHKKRDIMVVKFHLQRGKQKPKAI